MTYKEVIEWVTVQPIRLICLTIFCCITVISLSSCAAVSCQAMSQAEAERNVARYKYNAESSRDFWKK